MVGAARARRVTVPPQDRFFLLREERPPVGIVGFAVEGEPLDRSRLAKALERAMERHPKTASRLARERALLGERLFWEAVPGISERAFFFHAPDELPVDREALDALYARLLDAPFDLASGPALELHAFPGDGDRAFLLFRCHHALGDGFGMMHFLGDLLAAYNGEPVASPLPSAGGAAVPGRLRLLANLFGLFRRRRREIGSAPTDKLYDVAAEPGERASVTFRELGADRTAPLRRAARAHGVRFNDLMVSAWARGIERWKRERGLPSGTMRFMVNTGLREIGGGTVSFDNHSSAFPLWVRPQDRVDRKTLLACVRDQQQECLDLHVPEAIQLFRVFLRLPLGVLRWAMNRRNGRPQETETLIVSNLGVLPVALGEDDPGMRLGKGRLVGCYVSIRAPRGPGALLACASTGDLLVLGLSTLPGLIPQPDAARLFDCVLRELDAFAEGAS